MKIRVLVAALIIFFLSPQLTLAISSMDKKTISEAQDYGIKNISKSAGEFLYPWLSFEEQAEIIDESIEHAYFYTPFLLVADDARRKGMQRQLVKISDGEAVLADYAGYFVFSAVLKGDEPNFATGAKAILRQDKLAINSHVEASPVQKYETAQKTYYMANFYFYFKSEKLSLNKPVFLLVAVKNKQERRFYFDLMKIK